jgi:TPR repeat protein/WD40 repeat protein
MFDSLSLCPSSKRLILVGFLAALQAAWGQQRQPTPSRPVDSARPQLILQSAPSGLITCVEISPDGRWFASASAADGNIRIHEIQSGAVLRTVNAGAGSIEALAVTPDSRRIVSANASGEIRLWDVASGQLISEGKGPPQVRSVAVSPDGRFLAVLGDEAVQLIRLDGLAIIHAASLPSAKKTLTFAGRLLGFTAGSRALLLGHSDGSVRSLDPSTGEIVTLFQRKNAVEQMIASPNGRTVAFVEKDNGTWLWHEAEPGRFLRLADDSIWQSLGSAGDRTNGDDSMTRLLGFTADGKQFLMHCLSSFVISDATSGKKVSRVETDLLNFAAASWNSNSSVVIGSSMEVMNVLETLVGKFANLRLLHFSRFDLPTGRETRFGEGQMRLGLHPIVTEDRRWIFIPQAGGGTDLWETSSGRPVHHWDSPAMLTSASVSPRGDVLVETFLDETGRVFDSHDGKEVMTFQLAEKTSEPSTGFSFPKGPGSVIAEVSPDSKMFTNANRNQVGIWDLATGKRLHILVHDSGATQVLFSADSATLITASPGQKVRFWDTSSGQELTHRKVEFGTGEVVRLLRSPRADCIWLADSTGVVHEIAIATGAERRKLLDAGEELKLVAASSDGRLLATTASNTNRIRVWDATTGHLEQTFDNGAMPLGLEWISDRQLLTAQVDGSVRLWNLSSPQESATLMSSGNGQEWLVATDNGYFDGTPAEWTQLKWRFRNNTFDFVPVEAFFNEFYRPGLLSQLLAGSLPAPARSLAARDRRQPRVSLARDSAAAVGSRNVRVRIDVAELTRDAEHTTGSGVRDVRLFRNGTLVQWWHGNVLLNGRATATLYADVAAVAGENRFTAYAFNRDDVKSLDATLNISGAERLRRRGTFYVIAVGINHYDNPDFSLRYAVPDATTAAKVISDEQEKLHSFDRTEVISLLDQEATKANILAVFERLSGSPANLRPAIPQRIRLLPHARPEDAVVVYFAGHGIAHESHFYLVPSNLGLSSGAYPLDRRRLATLLEHSISDRELAHSVEKLDVASLALIVDACNSGQALGGEEQRQGPMNSTGLAQLAYEKGMYVLAAAQGIQAAMEVTELGHGLLTYSLIVEGLEKREAAHNGVVEARSWFEYATARVPVLQQQHLEAALSGGRNIAFVDDEQSRGIPLRTMQRPRSFYRREMVSDSFVLAKAPNWYRVAAEAGDAAGMRVLAHHYDNGIDVKQDPAEADRWKLKAAEAGDTASLMEFASRYAEGRRVDLNVQESVRFLALAAAAGSVRAFRLIGDLVYESGAPGSAGGAAVFYQKAAMAGDADSISMLGWMYAEGKGLEKDPSRALQWYLKGAAAGASIAMNNAGVCYRNGTGTAQDFAKALGWFRKAADAGDTNAMIHLAQLYEGGMGTTKNKAEAERWRQKAAQAQGSTTNPNRELMQKDLLAEAMTPEPPPLLLATTEVAWFSGLSISGTQRVWRNKGHDSQWFFEDGTPFLKGSDLLLDGPSQKSTRKIDDSGIKFVEKLKSRRMDLLYNEKGRIFFLTGNPDEEVHVFTSNIWQLDFAHGVYLPETKELKVSCKDAQVCAYGFTVKEGKKTIEDPADLLTIPVDDEAMAQDARNGLEKLAAQYKVSAPLIMPGIRWTP